MVRAGLESLRVGQIEVSRPHRDPSDRTRGTRVSLKSGFAWQFSENRVSRVLRVKGFGVEMRTEGVKLPNVDHVLVSNRKKSLPLGCPVEATSLFVHILAGSVAIVTGGVAVFAGKGAALHRRSGMWFVIAMIVMGSTGVLISVLREKPGTGTGGLIAGYFVITALTTVRPLGRKLDIAMLALALSIVLQAIVSVAPPLAAGRLFVNGVPIPMILLLATVTLSGAVGDIRLLRGRQLSGGQRIARHLWRMCWAFWIATGSFFLGQMDEFPAFLQNIWLMLIPALFPLAVMAYWLVRIRGRKLVPISRPTAGDAA
jgi:uncharacterized membrane protein